MNNRIFDNRFVYYAIIIILLVGAIFGLVYIKKYVGYAGVEVPAEAGYVTTIIIEHRQPTAHWHGLYGLVFSLAGWNEEQTYVVDPGGLSSFTTVFACVDPNQEEQELYASTNDTIDFSNIKAGTTSMIDDEFLNLTNDTADRANNTFTEIVNITLGTNVITGIPAVYTYVNDAPDPAKTFFTGILNASGKLVLVTRVLQDLTVNFKGNNTMYQMLLPVPNVSTKFYFFADPYDECPSGWGLGQVGDSIVMGYVFESNTTIPIPNATVSAGGNSSLTDSDGFFNFSVPGGRIYNLISIKEGYILNITSINTTIGYTTRQNLTMARFFGYKGPNGTISGYARNNVSGALIENVTISIAGLVTLSNSTGNYSFDVEEGTHVIAAVKDGYENFVGNFSINRYQNLSYIVNMTQVIIGVVGNGTLFQNGTIHGTVRDSSTGNVLENVTVTVAGESNMTNALGFYNITALEGTTNIVATKNGYDAYFAQVNITANQITVYNFSITPTIVLEGVGNGTVKGTVKTSSGAALSDVTVTVAGKSNVSNSTGEYFFLAIPAGTHNIVATRTAYDNYVGQVNVSENNDNYNSGRTWCW
jgi:hypothetical protein